MVLLLQTLLLLTFAASRILSLMCLIGPGMTCFVRQPENTYTINCRNDVYVLGMFAFEKSKLSKGKVLTAMCINVGNVNNCSESGPVNEYGKSFEYNCPEGKAISSVKYSYNGLMQDGIFEIQCCTVMDKTIKTCERWSDSTGYFQYAQMVNSVKQDVAKPAITGISSRFITRTMVTGENYKTRGYDIITCKV